MSLSLLFFIVAMLCLLGVVGILFTGLVLMAREGEKNRKTSNKMMQARVLMQGLAVAFLLLSWLSR